MKKFLVLLFFSFCFVVFLPFKVEAFEFAITKSSIPSAPGTIPKPELAPEDTALPEAVMTKYEAVKERFAREWGEESYFIEYGKHGSADDVARYVSIYDGKMTSDFYRYLVEINYEDKVIAELPSDIVNARAREKNMREARQEIERNKMIGAYESGPAGKRFGDVVMNAVIKPVPRLLGYLFGSFFRADPLSYAMKHNIRDDQGELDTSLSGGFKNYLTRQAGRIDIGLDDFDAKARNEQRLEEEKDARLRKFLRESISL